MSTWGSVREDGGSKSERACWGGVGYEIYVKLKNGYVMLSFPRRYSRLPLNLFVFCSKYCPAGCLLPFAEISGTIPHGYRDVSGIQARVQVLM